MRVDYLFCLSWTRWSGHVRTVFCATLCDDAYSFSLQCNTRFNFYSHLSENCYQALKPWQSDPHCVWSPCWFLHCDIRKSFRGRSLCLQLTGSDCSDIIKRKPSEIDLYVNISLLPVLARMLVSLLVLLSNVCTRTNQRWVDHF